MSPSRLKSIFLLLLALAVSACASTVHRDVVSQQPDAYVGWMRAVGLYPLTRIPVALGFSRWQAEYAHEVETWSGDDGLPWQVGTEGQESGAPEIVRRHAPVFLIDEASSADRFGYPAPQDDRVVVDTSRPVVTWRLGKMAFKGELLDQISYTLWFPERPKSGPLDLLGGSLDILIFRVTLSPDGTPLLYDTVHGCGCYHLFFPVPPTRRKAMPEDEDLRESAFVPFVAPVLEESERLGVRVSSGAHYVVGLEALADRPGQAYALASALEVGREIAPLYDRHGILPQSKRLERFILWPMGIRSAGAMRAWGTHATAFVGRRHFNDPDLLDRAFE